MKKYEFEELFTETSDETCSELDHDELNKLQNLTDFNEQIEYPITESSSSFVRKRTTDIPRKIK